MADKVVTILVVDDDAVNLRLVEVMLDEIGFKVLLASDTDAARRLLAEHPVDLILLDLKLPGEDGISFCIDLKDHVGLAEIPVVFLTGFGDLNNIVSGFDAGGVDFISKPFRREELQARVRTHTELYRNRIALQQKADEIKKISLARDKLYSVIAHDIRTPFSNISMMISLLEEGYLEPGSEDFHEILQGIKESVNDAFCMIENLLDWTRSNTETLKLHPAPASLSLLVDQALFQIKGNIGQKNLKVNLQIDPEHYILADTKMMKSVFRNLLSNAVKFTPKDGDITVMSEMTGNKCGITIRDHGVGMEQNQVERILAGEILLVSTGTEGERGSGIGLQIVSDFIRKNNGVLTISSSVGEGTSVNVILPAANETTTDKT